MPSKLYNCVSECVCLTKRSVLEGSVGADDIGMDDNIDNTQPSKQTTSHKEIGLSELGQLCMRTDALFPSMLFCIFNGLAWNDTLVCQKCFNLSWPMVKQLIVDGVMTSESAPYVFSAVLSGLQLHGQHDGSQANLINLALQLYEALRPLFREVKDVLLQIPNVSQQAVDNFDDRILQTNPQKQIPDKKKKEQLKNIIFEIIGKNVGQQFKREVHIKDLPPIFKPRRKQNISIVDTGTDKKDIGICSLFQPTNGNP